MIVSLSHAAPCPIRPWPVCLCRNKDMAEASSLSGRDTNQSHLLHLCSCRPANQDGGALEQSACSPCIELNVDLGQKFSAEVKARVILVCSREPDKQRSFTDPFQMEFAASSLTDRAATKYWHWYQHLAFGTGARWGRCES